MKKWVKNSIALGFGLLLSLLLIEIVLHLYNPFQSRIQGGRIILPVQQRYEFENDHIPGLGKHILHTKNKLGFRGPELPENDALRIFCVGGSTTECFYLSDGSDWPALMMAELKKKNKKIWVNNAGLDGHSTRGHLVLLNDHLLKLKPDVVVFLVGCNDVAANGLNRYEKYHIGQKKRLLEYSEIFNIYNNFRLAKLAKKRGMGHSGIDFVHHGKQDTVSWWKGNSKFGGDMETDLKGYRERLIDLGKMCEKNGAIPVFITQPTLLGDHVDPVSGRYLGEIDFEGESGLHYWFVLNKYNELLKSLCAEEKWNCIDAASLLPSTTVNYYDFFHYSQQGAEAMAQIVSRGLLESTLH